MLHFIGQIFTLLFMAIVFYKKIYLFLLVTPVIVYPFAWTGHYFFENNPYSYLYIYINISNPNTLNGWAIPSATDIAFSIGILSLLGSRVPISLKVFLTALAIIDDLGAIVIIAFFYTGDLNIQYLLLMLVTFILLLVLNKFSIKKFTPYLILGLFLWFFTHESGVHATIAGVLLASVIPHRKKDHDFSLLIKIEHAISPYVAYMIMPLFAFANAGVSLEGLSLSSLMLPVPLGILLGLFVGKQLGVFVFSYASIKFGLALVPCVISLIL